MAYRIEKEPGGTQAIVIDGWEGIAPDPYSGTGLMSSVDLSTPGEVSVGYAIIANSTSGATLGTPIARSTRFFNYGSTGYIPAGSAQSFAILDAGGQVFESSTYNGTFVFLSSSNSVTNSSATDGIAHWLGYLFKTRGTTIDYWNGSTWSTGWSTALTAGVNHYMYVGSDNVLYITNGNYLASISTTNPNTFDPTSGATYTVNASRLRLPTNDFALSIAEVGGGNTPQSTLLTGGILNAIYPWDKVSSSFALPIYVGDSYIGKMVSVNQNAFVFPGNQQGRGRIYITNGSQADLYYKVPDYITGIQDPYFVWGDALFHRNNLLFGFFPTTNSGSGVVGTGSPNRDVWALDLNTKAFRSISTIPSSSLQGNAVCLISLTSTSSPGFGYIAAWKDSTNPVTPQIGYSGTNAGVGSGTIITEQIPVGTFLNKKTDTIVEYKLRSPLQASESITITPIVDSVLGSALTFSPTVTTGAISGYASVNFQTAQWLAFNISIVGNSTTSGCRLREIRIR